MSLGHDEAGRPLVVGSDDQFTISRSHGTTATVTLLGRASRVGVDVECVRATSVTESLLAVSLAPGERALLAAAGQQEAAEAFFWFWTRKEAALKAIGTGLAHPPAEVDVATGLRWKDWVATDIEGHRRLWVRSFQTAAGEALSVACDEPESELHWLCDEPVPTAWPSATSRLG